MNIYSEMTGFSSNCRIPFINKCLNYVKFNLALIKYVYHTCSQLNNCWIINVYQVTVHNKFSKCLPLEPVHTRRRLITDFRKFLLVKVPARLWVVWRPLMLLLWSFSPFSFESDYTRVLSNPTGKNIKVWDQPNMEAVPRKLRVCGLSDTKIFSLFGVTVQEF